MSDTIIEVGRRYACKKPQDFGPNPIPRGHFSIVYRLEKNSEPSWNSDTKFNYLGIEDSGFIVFFNWKGVDEWFEFGGQWWELDLEKESNQLFELRRCSHE